MVIGELAPLFSIGMAKSTFISARELHLNTIADLRKDPNALYLYSDGSKINKSGFYRIGAAAVAYYMGNEVETGRLGLGGHAEVFDAEMAALSISATKAANIIDFPNTTNIHFFADNAASITALADPKPGPAQYFTLNFHHTLRPLVESNPNLHVTVSCSPSHWDISGNNRADGLANPKVGRFAIANRSLPSLRPAQHLLSLKSNRETFGRVLQGRTGHAYTGEFRQTFLTQPLTHATTTS